MLLNHPLITYIMEKAKSKNEYDKLAALLFVLQIPSICARIEIPRTNENSGKPDEAKNNPSDILYNVKTGAPFDKNLYFAWLRRHSSVFARLFIRLMPFERLCEAIYGLRNDMTHSGNLLELNSRLVLVDSDENGCLFSGRTLYVSVFEFCKLMLSAASDVFSVNPGCMSQVSKVDECLSFRLLPVDVFRQIDCYLGTQYDVFWKNRGDDLRLYQAYCFSTTDDIGKVECYMDNNFEWALDGFTRQETCRLVDIVHECDAFGDKLDDDVAKMYFN